MFSAHGLFADPTFVLFGLFSCTTSGFPICTDDNGFAACQLTCLSCPICEDPDPIPGVDVIFQNALIGENDFIIYIDNTLPVSGLQAGIVCESNGGACLILLENCQDQYAGSNSQIRYYFARSGTEIGIQPLSGQISPALAESGFEVSVGNNNLFIIISLDGWWSP